jgi:hypothetical protein
MAKDQVTLHLRTAEVEVTILEAQSLGDLFVAVQHKGRRIGLGEDGQFRGHHLHVAGGQVGIGATGWALDYRSDDRDDVLVAQPASVGMGINRHLWVEHDLNHAFAVS